MSDVQGDNTPNVSSTENMTSQQLESLIDTTTNTAPVTDVITDMTQPSEELVSTLQPQTAEMPNEELAQQPPVTTPAPPDGVKVGIPEQLEKSALDDLISKKNLKSPEELASIYINLEKKMHQQAQELSQLRNQPVPQPVASPTVPPQEPQYYTDDTGDIVSQHDVLNQQFRTMWERDPVGTQIKLTQLLVQPVLETNNEIKFKNELIRLSSSPNTADFNTPEVQQEIQNLISENPQKYGTNIPENIKDLYYMAKGRLASSNIRPITSQTVSNVTPQNNNKVIVEGRNKSSQQQSVDPNNLSASQLEDLIKTKT